MATILVVDDSAVDRRMAGGLLERNPDYILRYAENGAEALQRMYDDLPDLVITDLQMPEMDGLELVRAIRVQYPDVPVVLMTAHGSEDIAVEALEHGAASYVPKSQLAGKLAETVENIFAISASEANYNRLIECMDSTEFRFKLANDPGLIDPLVDLLRQIIGSMDLCDPAGRLQLGVALEQALLNAMYRGNLDIKSDDFGRASEQMLEGQSKSLIEERVSQAPYKDRRVYVHAVLAPSEARFIIRDEGAGFDWRSAGNADDAAALHGDRGRGLVLMRTFMDEVTFNDAGNEVTMVKRRMRPSA